MIVSSTPMSQSVQRRRRIIGRVRVNLDVHRANILADRRRIDERASGSGFVMPLTGTITV